MFDMSKIICVTNRKLCIDDFETRLDAIAKLKPASIILRERDLSAEDYFQLATKALKICEKNGVTLIPHNFVDTAKQLNSRGLHMPLEKLKEMSALDRRSFSILGTSCHNLSEVREAEKLGCTYVILGHIFQTACKADLHPRGIDFLREVCDNTDLPVLAIGGITSENIYEVMDNGAGGACIMSGFMNCSDVKGYIERFHTT